MERYKKHIEEDCKSRLTFFCVNSPRYKHACWQQAARQGETFVDQRATTTFNSRYTFSAKEKDDETQYSYFGARYFSDADKRSFVSNDSDLSVWLSAESADQCVSMDPMSDKYPSMSAYMYCAGNPVILVDPYGRDIEPTFFNGENGDQSAVYAKCVIDQALDGQFEAILASGQNGTAVLNIRPTKGGGDFSKMSESALAFYNELAVMVNDHSTRAKIDVVFGSGDVRIGDYGKNAIDIAYIIQFNPSGKNYESVGATRAGKLTHELVEQYHKAKDGIPKGSMANYNINHQIAIKAEDRVNGNVRQERIITKAPRVFIEQFKEKNGSVTNCEIDVNYSIIKVTQPKPNKH